VEAGTPRDSIKQNRNDPERPKTKTRRAKEVFDPFRSAE
jgi:hypothetical protein